MYKLSIITINFNNLEGLKKTVESVLSQTSKEFEYVLIDGGSTDGSCEFIDSVANKLTDSRIKWISEKDNGIYHAMNKGIIKSSGKFLQFLNSGDVFVDENVTSKMLSNVSDDDQIVYGNMLKLLPKGLYRDKGFEGRKPTMLDFYFGTLNHSPAYIKRSLFNDFGFYDETLRIVSDWKWYLQVIIFADKPIKYIPIDVTLFDMNGISNQNSALERDERENVLRNLISKNIFADYHENAYGMLFYRQIKKYKLAYYFFILFDRFYSWIERNFKSNYIKK